jgi:hypothetical protein
MAQVKITDVAIWTKHIAGSNRLVDRIISLAPEATIELEVGGVVAIEALEAAGLRHRSIIRLKVFTMPTAIVLRQIGSLLRTDRSQLVQALGSAIGPDLP